MSSKKGLTSADVLAIRNRMELTQQEFAEAVGCSVSSVQKWELGNTPNRMACKLMKLLEETK